MNNYKINGFIKRAQQYGLDENQIENLVKKAFNLNELKSLLAGVGNKATSFGQKHIVDPITQIPENYNEALKAHNLSTRGVTPDSSFSTKHRENRNTKLLQLLQGLGTAGGVGLAGAGAAYGGYKGLSSLATPNPAPENTNNIE